MLTIVIVPVGATEFSQKGELLGINNPPLGQAGMARAEEMADALRGTILEAVFSGPLKRQIVTARRIAEPHQLPIRTDKNLIDVNYGSWSGRSWSEISQEDGQLMDKMKRSPHRFRFPSGEKMKKSWKRYQAFTRHLLGNYGAGHVVIVADGFVAMMLTSLITGTDFISLEPWENSGSGITKIDRDEGRNLITMLKGTKRPATPPTK